MGQSEQDVKEFGVYAEDLTALCRHLKNYGVTTVAMASTRDYRQNLFAELIKYGFDIILCNGKFTKHAKGKKTDVKDVRQIQKLHALGLLTSSFLPDEQTEILRTYTRRRSNHIQQVAAASRKMQKYLKFLNFRLDVVVKDICGPTGMKITKTSERAIWIQMNWLSTVITTAANLKKRLPMHCTEIIEAIFSPGSNKSLGSIGSCKACDKQIDRFIKDYFKAHPALKKLKTNEKPQKRENKIAPAIKNFNQLAFQYFGGVDLLAIEGLSHSTVLSIMAEIGPEGFKKFKTSKEFISRLRLAPNNKISGGKILSTKVHKGSNRLKIALRQAANAIGNLKDTHSADFFKRVAYRKGRQAAVSATVRKLRVIIWNMITKKQPYQPPTQYLFRDQKRKLGLVKRIRKQIDKFEIKPEEVGFLNHTYSNK